MKYSNEDIDCSIPVAADANFDNALSPLVGQIGMGANLMLVHETNNVSWPIFTMTQLILGDV